MMVDGASDLEVSRVLHVSKQAITEWRHRHTAEIQPAVEEAARLVIDYAIAHKVNRIAEADQRRQLIHQVREARAKGGSGMETGIVARTYKALGAGENQQVVEEYRVDTAFLAEWRANERQVAEELDQLPRANVNIDNRTQILIREYKGYDPEALS